MAEITYEDVTPTLIPNTTMLKMLRDGVHKTYRITPNEGYVLHDKARDWDHTDDDGNITESFQGFTRVTASCPASYDFTPVTVNHTDGNGYTVPVTAYGAQREFYAVLESEAPADHIFGGGNNDHEVM